MLVDRPRVAAVWTLLLRGISTMDLNLTNPSLGSDPSRGFIATRYLFMSFPISRS